LAKAGSNPIFPAVTTSSKPSPEYLAVWWQSPEASLREPKKIIRQILKMGTPGDYLAACDIWGEEAFRQALVTAPPGGLDERSWEFWHRCYGIEAKPTPKRTFG
jgi:hypothetical protein